MAEGRRHAVVLGASMAGLGAARALVDHFDQVTVVERDVLPTITDNRKGVPQGHHAHGLLPSGYRILDAYFPGMMQEMIDEGVPYIDLTGDFLWYQYGGWKLRTDSGLGGIGVSRPFLERKVRERVRSLPNVTLREGYDVEEPIYDPSPGSVSGVRIKSRATGEASTLDAELLVDALGRGSPSPKWLAAWGFGEVTETLVQIDVGYATAVFERRPGDMHGASGAILAGTAPQSTRYAAVIGVEGSRWIITLVGCVKDYPPTDVAGWREFARSLPVPELYEMVKDREPLIPITSYRFPANRHRHYERLSRFPGGFLLLGDALCSFNPLYGQGMSVALREAWALDDCLRAGTSDLAARFFKSAREIVESPWAIATGEDYRYPQVPGKRPPGFGVISRYMERAHRAATRDPVVLKQFFDVASLLAPPTAMLAPKIAWRVLLGGIGSRPEGPKQKVVAATASR
jgi:2-polyprenyl-6-methoxyphenol hydroxylase-like FAD-dependent oxidoreductase